ncbi:uncharacterized protein [Gossypium hirsutum]|uniref:Uncharacterized protein n=1 Tax=Gossypium hirsutum TaxID=3635 RepID=A0A1U8L3K5_GOSHI|nr:uncharacterized protein LOC107923547 [Gossypium hirsutum]
MDARILQLKAAIYSAKIVTDIPLYETPWDLFDEYLEDKPRVFNSMFPHKHSIQQLYEFHDITKLLEVQLTRCELQGLDKVIDSSSHFALGVKARLYPDRRGNKSRIRGDCEINISLVFPPTFTFIPGGAIRDILVKGVSQ